VLGLHGTGPETKLDMPELVSRDIAVELSQGPDLDAATPRLATSAVAVAATFYIEAHAQQPACD
jgi:hypothetical protein